MKRKRRAVRAAALLLPLLLAGSPSVSQACGFHDPITLAKAFIALVYPDATHVDGAVWSAQKSGIIAMPDKERLLAAGPQRERLNKLAFFSALKSLKTLGSAMDKAAAGGKPVNVSLVLLETVLWTRYANSAAGIETRTHITGAQDGDLVVVTDELVVHAIVQGKLAVNRAVELGLMRLYGSDEQENQFLAQFGSLGGAPMKAPPVSSLFRGLVKADQSKRPADPLRK
jgi:hypothetical protein